MSCPIWSARACAGSMSTSSLSSTRRERRRDSATGSSTPAAASGSARVARSITGRSSMRGKGRSSWAPVPRSSLAHGFADRSAAVRTASCSAGGSAEEATSGPGCRARGEVEATTILGHSNKAHDGFVGHSYIAEWVNLGALTTTSDLKNNYGTIHLERLWPRRRHGAAEDRLFHRRSREDEDRDASELGLRDRSGGESLRRGEPLPQMDPRPGMGRRSPGGGVRSGSVHAHGADRHGAAGLEVPGGASGGFRSRAADEEGIGCPSCARIRSSAAG